MRKILFQILFLGIGIASCQAQSKEPFYEQIAFDYFRTKILTETQKGQKIKIDLDNYFWSSQAEKKKIITCFLDSNNNESDLNDNLDFDKYGFSIDLKNDKRFKRKRFWNGNSPRVEISVPMQFIEKRVFVIVKLINHNKGEFYYIEMNAKGEVFDYCSEGYTTITIS